MFSSYLNGSYLGGSELEAPVAMPMAPALLPPQQLAGDDLVSLPGGIVLPKRTLWLIAAAIAVAALVWWKQQKGKA